MLVARIGRPDILWSVTHLARSVTKLTQACDRRLAVMWETRHSTAGMGYFKTQTLQATLRIQSEPQEVSCVFFWKQNICSSQLDVQETNNQFLIAPQSLKLFLWILDCEWMGSLLLTEGNIVIEVLHSTKDNSQPLTLRES